MEKKVAFQRFGERERERRGESELGSPISSSESFRNKILLDMTALLIREGVEEEEGAVTE